MYTCKVKLGECLVKKMDALDTLIGQNEVKNLNPNGVKYRLLQGFYLPIYQFA